MASPVFVSHASKDAEKVSLICQFLEKRNIAFWVSSKNIQPGLEWNKEIENALLASSHVLIVVTNSSIKSSYVLSEVEYALDNEKTVIPLLMEDVKLPVRWHTLQYIDLSNEVEIEHNFDQLVKLLPRRMTGSRVLITAGNVFQPTFDGVCYAVKTLLGDVDTIEIFDTAESATSAENTQRNQQIIKILGASRINTSIIRDNDAQQTIPNRVAQLIRDYGTTNIIVDLSNGQKFTVSILYAVATITRITNIFALDFKVKPNKDTNITELKYPKEWDYIRINPLEGLLNIAQSSYIELVYYRDKIDELMLKLKNKNVKFGNDVQDRLNHALVNYFAASSLSMKSTDSIEACINSLGKVCEDIVFIWYDYCRKLGIIKTQANAHVAKIRQITSLWEEYRSLASRRELDDTDTMLINVVVPTLGTDILFEAMRIYRNFASHSTHYYKVNRQDARLTLDLTLLALEQLLKSDILAP